MEFRVWNVFETLLERSSNNVRSFFSVLVKKVGLFYMIVLEVDTVVLGSVLLLAYDFEPLSKSEIRETRRFARAYWGERTHGRGVL